MVYDVQLISDTVDLRLDTRLVRALASEAFAASDRAMQSRLDLELCVH